MKTSLIRYRVADFLKQSAPFDAMSEEDLLELATTGRVSFHETGEFVFRKNQPRKPCLWVIQQGTVEIIDEAEQGHRLRDLLSAGDTLGLGYFLDSEAYLHSARTASDVILYSIDARSFATQVEKYPHVARFLAAQFSVAARYEDVLHAKAGTKLPGQSIQPVSWLDAEGPSREFLRARLCVCSPERPLREAAAVMNSNRRDAIAVVNGKGTALGIITNRALAEHLASGPGGANDTCESIMVARFPTASPDLKAEAYLLQMMGSRSPFLAITRDGTPRSPLEGLLCDRDLALFTGRNVPALLDELLNVGTSIERQTLLKQAQALKTEALTGPASFKRVASIAGLLDAALAESIVRTAQAEAAGEAFDGAATLSCCWLLFGRAGRGELIESLQPEIGVVHADPPPGREAEVARYFEAIARSISNQWTDCGVAQPRASADERNILRFRSLSQWKQFFRDMIANPIEADMYATRRFLDYRVLHGDAALERALSAGIMEDLKASRAFIPILANDTMEHLPPMTFFQGLVVELDGAQTQTLDLEITALRPIIDAARVFCLAAGDLDAKSTLERLDVAATMTPDAANVFHEAAGAFRVASCYAATATMNNPSRGPLIDPSELTKYDQRLLKTAFQSIEKLIEYTSTL